ncbi:YbaB/EbfC family nucleoid-associated protein [Actinophytocola sp. NPDC049390]|uniref:YbaB/EbfC family nucleoid-associated protein n=1 Tax=Actinophytocola sp. NPDC049390 TaxID=3363894 RepID=UPI0037AAA4A2
MNRRAEVTGRLDERLDRLTTALETLAEVRVSASSADESVRVEVDAGGRVVSLTLSEAVRSRRAARTSRDIMACIARARAATAAEVRTALVARFGQGDALADEVAARFEGRPPAGEPRPPKPAGADDEPFDIGQVMRPAT